MKKTLTITLNGAIFNIEEDGYGKLKIYLDSIRDYFSEHEGNQEILSDIEARAAEKFSEKISASNQVVSLADVEELIKSMGTVEDIVGEEKSEPQDPKAEKIFWKKKKLYRDGDNAVIMGVASGIANYFGIDPVFIRLAFIASLFFGGIGVLAYIILCFIVPEAKTTTEKMKMHGQPINLSSLKEATEEKISEAKEKISTTRPIRKMVLIIASIVKKIARWFSLLLGIFVVIGAVFGFIGIFFFFGNLVFNANSPYLDFPLKELLLGINYYLAMTAGFLTISIPIIFGFLIGISLIKKQLIINLIGGITLLMVWIISFTTLGIYAVKVAPQYNEKARSIENAEKTARNYAFRDFDSISANGDYEIAVVRGDDYKVEATGLDQDLKATDITLDGKTLNIKEGEREEGLCIFCFNSHHKVKIEITAPNLKEYTVGGIVRSSLKGFREDQLKLILRGSTNTTADINAKSATVRMNGVAKLKLSGSFDDLATTLDGSASFKASDFSIKNTKAILNGTTKLDLSGSADSVTAIISDSSNLMLSEFSVKDLKISASEASRARIWATEQLDATGKDSSKIYYRGDPKIIKDISEAALLIKED